MGAANVDCGSVACTGYGGCDCPQMRTEDEGKSLQFACVVALLRCRRKDTSLLRKQNSNTRYHRQLLGAWLGAGIELKLQCWRMYGLLRLRLADCVNCGRVNCGPGWSAQLDDICRARSSTLLSPAPLRQWQAQLFRLCSASERNYSDCAALRSATCSHHLVCISLMMAQVRVLGAGGSMVGLDIR